MKCAIATGLVVLVLSLLPRAAHAVVISPTYDEPNLRAPADDPGWNNVGRVNGGSAVYLGNRWVITAAHVGSGQFRLADGRVFTTAVGSPIQLSNSGGLSALGRPDLVMFRLTQDPGLPALSVASQAPAVGARVTMIGSGRDKDPAPIGWLVQSTPQGANWAEVPLPNANQVGYALQSTGQMRWGVNHIATASSFNFMDTTHTFTTRFDQQGTAFEAQATTGDSGGGVFENLGDAWQLSGIITSIQLLNNQPSGVVVYGNQTVIADVAAYRNEIVARIDRAEPLWQNQVNYYDVSGNGTVNPRDANQLINELLLEGAYDTTGVPGPGDYRFDVNGDYRVSPTDLNQLISYLLTGPPQVSPAAAGVTLVPEPASATLACGAAISALFARVVWRRKKRTRLKSH